MVHRLADDHRCPLQPYTTPPPPLSPGMICMDNHPIPSPSTRLHFFFLFRTLKVGCTGAQGCALQGSGQHLDGIGGGRCLRRCRGLGGSESFDSENDGWRDVAYRGGNRLLPVEVNDRVTVGCFVGEGTDGLCFSSYFSTSLLLLYENTILTTMMKDFSFICFWKAFLSFFMWILSLFRSFFVCLFQPFLCLSPGKFFLHPTGSTLRFGGETDACGAGYRWRVLLVQLR